MKYFIVWYRGSMIGAVKEECVHRAAAIVAARYVSCDLSAISLTLTSRATYEIISELAEMKVTYDY